MSDGLGLSCRILGEGSQSLLCLPGLARTGEDFRAFARHLPAGWRAICPDYRGRGLSDRDPRPARYHNDTYVRDSIELLNHLEIDRFAVLGSSFGGWVAMNIAGRLPARCRGLVLNDIGPEVPRQAALQYMQFVGRRPSPKRLDPAFSRQMRNAHRAGPVLGLVCRLGLMRHSAPAVFGYRKVFAALPRELPVLVLRGQQSGVLTQEAVAEMRTLRPGLVAVTVPGAGHTPRLDEPVAVSAIGSFLDSL